MKRLIGTLVVLLAAMVVWAGTAFAGGGPVQSSTQSAGTEQSATAASSATQVQPSNDNISVRVLSPGDDGSVSQSNTANSSANASNNGSTTQSSTQKQGGCGCSPFDSTISGAQSGDPSAVLSGADQMTGGSDGHQPAAAPDSASSSQTNDAGSTGDASNAAPTTQTGSQSQSGGSGGVQSSQQSAGTEQGAVAASSAKQIAPSNQNISVRVLSPGNDGDVSQSNDATSSANASNTASTTQGSSQAQGGGSGVQSAVQDAGTEQKAVGLSSATQVHPTNSNTSVRVLSPGDDGSVSQANDATSSATATNNAPTTQTASQEQKGSSCGCDGHSPAVQAIGQSSWTKQAGIAASEATQIDPSNSNDPVRIWSYGNGGDVSQSNDATSSATTTNTASTTQSGTQKQSPSKCGCDGGKSVQALAQYSSTGQFGLALSAAVQKGASNSSDPVRIWSKGDDGSVSQANDATSSADSTNTAATTQTGSQWQSGSGVQALGQEAKTWQGSAALSLAAQLPGESRCGCGSSFGNEAGPVRVASPGDGGDVTQSNDATSRANSTNDGTTYQDGRQGQMGSCGCSGLGVQALGQKAETYQLGKALSAALQVWPTNSSSPVRVWSPYGDGMTSQENGATSAATPDNTARSGQTAAQQQ